MIFFYYVLKDSDFYDDDGVKMTAIFQLKTKGSMNEYMGNRLNHSE